MNTKVTFTAFLTALGVWGSSMALGQEAEPARAQETVLTPSTANEQIIAEEVKPDSKSPKKPQDYDLSALPEDLRKKVEAYLEEQEAINVEIARLDGMAKAASNPWAQQRATGMATKLNYELKNLRLQRREIIREYRELLRSGWTPPESMVDFESLFFAQTGETRS